MSVKILTITALLFFVSCWSSADTKTFDYCCHEASSYISGVITDCIKQQPSRDCNSSNYAVRLDNGKWFCIKGDSRWLKRMIDSGRVYCHN